MNNSHADILLVTVTKVESQAVLTAFTQDPAHRPQAISIGDLVYRDLGTIQEARIFLVQSEMGSAGLGGSLLTVQKSIDSLSPKAVIMVGIAFGVNEKKQKIGDILVSNQLRPYDLQRVGVQEASSKIILRSDKPHASPRLINLFRTAEQDWDGAPVQHGVILSGEKLIDNLDYRNQLLALEEEAVGGEMEGAGLYIASQDKKTDWILVKAICDWADGNKAEDKDNRQQHAAQNAASFVWHVLNFSRLPGLDTQDINVNSPSHGHGNLQQFVASYRTRASVLYDHYDFKNLAVLPGEIRKTQDPKLDAMYLPIRFAATVDINRTEEGNALDVSGLLQYRSTIGTSTTAHSVSNQPSIVKKRGTSMKTAIYMS